MKLYKLMILLSASLFCAARANAQSPKQAAWGAPVELVPLSGLNTTALDFSAVPFGKGIIFTSNRNGLKGNQFDETEKIFCTDLMYAERTGFGQYKAAENLTGKVNTEYHEGVPSIYAGDQTMYYSGNGKMSCKTAGVMKVEVLEAKLQDGKWKNVAEMPFNIAGYASCHPAVSADGRAIVFASDRPGTIGGMDLWACTRTETGWSMPMNLGPTVNTSGNELFPFVANDGTLFFASQGHDSKGKLDVFMTKPKGKGDWANWSMVENLGEPFNTVHDDFGFYLMADGLSGYLSSNRADGKNDDLYEWRAPAKKAKMPMLAGKVIEKGSGTPVANTKIILRNKKTNESRELMSDAMGEFTFDPLECDNDYELIVGAERPNPVKRDISTRGACATDEPRNEKVVVELPAPYVPALTGLVRETPSKLPIANTQIVLLNKKTGAVKRLTSDANGNFKFALECNSEYELTVGAEREAPIKRDITTVGKCEMANPKDENVVVEIPVKPAVVDGVPTTEKITTGMVIRLNKLYYDYNKDNIRPDAAVELDKVVVLMKQYPSMVIELSSHTDSRGSDDYNRSLSERRAASARNYIVSKGVAATRISAFGKGESEPVNQCTNGVKCSDADYQVNRRTEVKVVSINEEGVKVEGSKN